MTGGPLQMIERGERRQALPASGHSNRRAMERGTDLKTCLSGSRRTRIRTPSSAYLGGSENLITAVCSLVRHAYCLIRATLWRLIKVLLVGNTTALV